MTTINQSDDEVSIKGLDKALVLQALWTNAKSDGTLHSTLNARSNVSLRECRDALTFTRYFDSWNGRILNVDLTEDTFRPDGYDKHNGKGAAAKVVQVLRLNKLYSQ